MSTVNRLTSLPENTLDKQIGPTHDETQELILDLDYFNTVAVEHEDLLWEKDLVRWLLIIASSPSSSPS